MNIKLKRKDKKWYHIKYSTLTCCNINELIPNEYIVDIKANKPYQVIKVEKPYFYLRVDNGVQEKVHERYINDYRLFDEKIDQKNDNVININTNNTDDDTIINDTDIEIEVEADKQDKAKVSPQIEKTEAELMLEKIRHGSGSDISMTSNASAGQARSSSLSDIKYESAIIDPQDFSEQQTSMDAYMESLADNLSINSHTKSITADKKKKVTSNAMDNLKGLTKPIIQPQAQFSSGLTDLLSNLEWTTGAR